MIQISIWIGLVFFCSSLWAEAPLSVIPLNQYIQDHKIKSIEQLLAEFSDSYRSHYALVFESRSLHESSWKNPRVLLYGSDAHLIVSFNGDSSQKGFRELELMEFDATQKSFHFYELSFLSGQTPTLTEPQKCLQCHGNPTRPIWDSLPTWPGVVGQRYHMKLTSIEKQGLQEFLKFRNQNPRYSLLQGIEVFSIPETFQPTAQSHYNEAEKNSPNIELGRLLEKMNFQAIAKQVAENPAFHKFQYALFASLHRDCQNPGDLMDPSQKKKILAEFEKFVQASSEANQKQLHLKELRIAGGGDASSPVFQVQPLNPFRFWAEKQLGLSTGAWTMALEKNSYDFTGLTTPEQELQKALMEQHEHLDPEIALRFSESQVSSSEKYCQFLARKSQQALSETSRAPAQQPTGQPPDQITRTEKPVKIQLCQRCHETGVGPDLPFGDENKLARVLKRSGYSHGSLSEEILFRLSEKAGAKRMPLGINLSPDEQRALEIYFMRLSQSSELPQ